MRWHIDLNEGLPLWRLEPSNGDTVLAFSTRIGGSSLAPYDTLNLGRSTDDSEALVAENRRRVLTALGLDPTRLATAGQIHGSRVAEANTPALHHGADALLCKTPGLAVAVTCADCLPLIYTAPRAVAVAHSGWRGTAAGMPSAALDALCRAAAVKPAQVTVHLGPSIRGCCYRVGHDVAQRFPASAVTFVDDEWLLDLTTAAQYQLEKAGVPADQIVNTPDCTACHPSRYFSHRRDGAQTGRQWAVAAVRN